MQAALTNKFKNKPLPQVAETLKKLLAKNLPEAALTVGYYFRDHVNGGYDGDAFASKKFSTKHRIVVRKTHFDTLKLRIYDRLKEEHTFVTLRFHKGVEAATIATKLKKKFNFTFDLPNK